ncbi:unnamed protein product [Boreogadus saida]
MSAPVPRLISVHISAQPSSDGPRRRPVHAVAPGETGHQQVRPFLSKAFGGLRAAKGLHRGNASERALSVVKGP